MCMKDIQDYSSKEEERNLNTLYQLHIFITNSRKHVNSINGLTDKVFHISISITETGVLASNVC